MGDLKYKVVFQGKLNPRADPAQVRQRLSALFKTNLKAVERLFAGKPVVIKAGVTLEVARKYVMAMAKVGASAHIQEIKPSVNQARIAGKQNEQNKTRPAEHKPKQQAPAKLTREQIGQKIMAGFKGTLEPTGTTFAYRVSLLMVAIVMIVLPITYTALTAATGYGIYYHTVNNTDMFKEFGSIYISASLYFTPIIIGSVLVAFMCKPILLLFVKPRPNLTVHKTQEPLLFAFVEKICALVNAPKPKRIDIDCQVNASASFNKGFASFFGNDMVLTIGMPLVAGLNTRQFAGVLGHEFGHFAQAAGMRLTYLIRTINFWLSNSVYQRDRFDQMLETHSSSGYLHLNIVFSTASLFVWAVRRILWVFMYIGYGISGSLLRQMEFDADRYEARIAGSEQFEPTSGQIQLLNASLNTLYDDLYETWQNNQYLVDNVAEANLEKLRRFPTEARQEILEYSLARETGFFDTHPCDHERIENAEREHAPGAYLVALPASSLFKDYNTLARKVTLRHYRTDLGIFVKSEQLVPLSKLKQNLNQEQENFNALANIFGEAFSVFVPLEIGEADKMFGAEPAKVQARWQEIVREMPIQLPKTEGVLKRWDKTREKQLLALQAAALRECDFSINPKEFGLNSDDSYLAQQRAEHNEGVLKELATSAAETYKLITERLRIGLSLVLKESNNFKNQAVLAKEISTLADVLTQLQAVRAQILGLGEHYAVLHVLLVNVDNAVDRNLVMERLIHEAESAKLLLKTLYGILRGIPYPFEHAQGKITMAHHICPIDPEEIVLESVYDASNAILDSYVTVYARIVGRLATLIHQVEVSAGFGVKQNAAA